MTHLDSVTIHNFKSFKHVNIKFSKGFNCIVGANGSGKSNICDSLLFALGESSLKRMRVPNTTQLINSFAKPRQEDGVKRAYVKINFSGDPQLEIARVIKSNNKIGYRLNGKGVTKQEIVEALMGQRTDINDTNIIVQNEISYMINMNSKERRELIDLAAGIKEFNDKKDDAMRELEKVQTRINETQIALNERRGFLDQLEKEKEDAERYIKLSETVKSISYTLLKNSETLAESDYKSMSEALANVENRKKAATAGINEIDLVLEKLSSEKATLSKNLAERSVELSSTNKILENINKETAVKETQINSLKERIAELESQEGQLRAEQKKIRDEAAEDSKMLNAARSDLGGKEKLLASKEMAGLEAQGRSKFDRLNQNQKRIDELYANSESASKQYMQYKFEIESLESSIKSQGSALTSKTADYGNLAKNAEKQKEALSRSESSIIGLSKELESLQGMVKRHQSTMDEIYVDSVNLREKLSSMGGGADRISDYLKRNMAKGFYGRAYELCTYEDKYAVAVNAAAMSRLGYLVVDSAETADRAIRLLKEKHLGRATFIPMNDMVSRRHEERNGLERLVDHVKFEKRFESAFNYIFANTYMVESIENAKSIGFGKARYVTLGGEVIEPSGIITGGSARQLQSPALLESKLKSLEDRKFATSSALEEVNSKIGELQKAIASEQVAAMNASIELKHSTTLSESLKKELDQSAKAIEGMRSRLDKLASAYSETDSERNSLLTELNKLKAENEGIYAMAGASPKHRSSSDGNSMEELRSLRSAVETLRINIATLSKEQELRNERMVELEAQIKSKNDEGKETRKRMAILDAELQELGKGLNEILKKIGKSDADSQGLYKRMQELDSKMSKLGMEKGKYQSDLERANRDTVEQETRKVQLQTRITDIKAEMMSYQNVNFIEGHTQEELESKRTIAKHDIEVLGAVNLKAPEVYELKKKDVDEASSRLNVLGNEGDSIIAMISEIESRKLNIFNGTLNDVNANFQRLYGYIFEGSASLRLDDPKDPFNSGLAITIKSPKNRNSTVETLSGGEKSLVIIMLIFAIQAHNPMSLYIFDEIDASLDKENSKKLSRLMKEMSRKSQLIVISHNDSLITAADTAIGVVHRSGESRVVGLQLTPAHNAESK